MMNRRPLPISEFQKRFFLEWALAPEESTYNVSLVNKISSELDEKALKQACEVFIKRNEVIHARYSDDGTSCYFGDYEIDDFYHESTFNANQDVESQIRAVLEVPFDLTKEVLFRFHLIKSGRDSGYYFILVAHHIIADALTALQVSRQIQDAYDLLVEGRPVSLAVEKTFTQAVELEQKLFDQDYKAKSQQFWLDFIGDFPLNIRLPYRSDVAASNFDAMQADKTGGFIYFSLSPEETVQVRAIAKQKRTTVFIVLSALYGLVLSKYSNQERLLLNYPIDIRPRGFKDITGCFVNNVPLKLDLNTVATLDELIAQLGAQRKSVKRHQGYSLTEIIQDQRKHRDEGTTSFFNVGITQANLNSLSFTLKDQEISPVDISSSDLIVDELGLLYDEYSSDVIKFKFEYRKALFDQHLVQRFLGSFQETLRDVINGVEINTSTFTVLNPEEKDTILYKWNDTDEDFATALTIDQCFREQAKKAPETTALVYGQQELSYRDLDEKTNQLARHIRSRYHEKTKQALGPDVLIALCLDRSLEMVIGILAVLKAGAAYVPMDINYPPERMDYILKDTGAELILSQKHLSDAGMVQLPEDKIIHLDLSEALYQTEDNSDLPSESASSDLAYVIYTSGTTGRPKGVLIDHRPVMNLVNFHNKRYASLSDNLQVALLSNYNFDFSVQQIFSSILYGHTLHVISSDLVLNPTAFNAYIKAKQIEVFEITPVLFSHLVFPFDNYQDSHLKLINIGGENLSSNLIAAFLGKNLPPEISILNTYGPTEFTVDAVAYEIDRKSEDIFNHPSIPIGKPLDNTRAYILGSNQDIVPIGVAGELHLAGAGLARGYLNRPELTAASFIPNPFATLEDKAKGYTRMYKTGDLVRWLPDGNIEFIGRIDDQVKVRGHRIELGEIENAFTQIEGIKQCCVLAKARETASGNSNYLVGYYTLDKSIVSLSQTAISDQLSALLPDYMVPTMMVEMEFFPLTVNGKLNKRALPEVNFNEAKEAYVAPVTEIETLLAGIWQDVLGLHRVGSTDDFFRIGGDSILSIQVSSRIRQAGFHCQAKDLFECRPLAKLAKLLGSQRSEVEIKTEQGILTGAVDLLPVQRWFVGEVEQESITRPDHWNQSFLIKVPELDPHKLESILDDLVAHHDALRMHFVIEQSPDDTGKSFWKQAYQAKTEIPPLKSLDVSQHSETAVHEILTEWQGGFNLTQGPLFQVGYLHGYEDGSARIYFACHHLIVDAVSWRILTEDIQALYAGKALPDKGSSYRQWVETVKDYPENYPDEGIWWAEQLEGMPANQMSSAPFNPTEKFLELDQWLTGSLLQEASKAYHTEINDLLLTALSYALKEVNGGDIQGITLEGHGREDLDDAVDTSRAVGWFTSLFPVKLEIKNSLEESIRGTKESLRQVPNKGIGFGAFSALEETGFSQQDLPRISFNYLGQFDTREGDWQIAQEESGNNIHPENSDRDLISLNGMVNAGRLVFSVVTQLGEETTKQFTQLFKKHLQKVIEHCKEKLAQFGSSYTPSDFKSVRISQPLLDRLQTAARRDQNEIVRIVPATSLQQGFIYHTLSQTEDQAYRVQLLYDFRDVLDIDLYIRAWENCIAKYPILRTAFNWEEEIIQVVYQQSTVDYRVHDISDLSTQEERDAAIEAIREEDRTRSFDLTQPRLIRLNIIKQAADCYTIINTEHHSVSDGWSGPVLLENLFEQYEALIAEQEVDLQEDTAYFEALEYIDKHKGKIEEYWKNNLGTVERTNDLNALLSEPIDIRNYRTVEQPRNQITEITGDFYQEIKAFSQQEGVTINVIIEFIWHKLVQVYSSSTQTVVGTTVSGRDIPIDGIENSVGLYINTLPLVIDWDHDDSISKQLQHIQQQTTALGSNSYVDLAKLQKEGERLFQSLFVYENYPIPKLADDIPKIRIRNAVDGVDYVLGIMAYEHGDTLSIKLQYDGKHLTESHAANHLETLGNMLSQVIQSPEKSHHDISIINREEYDLVINQWNETAVDFSSSATIHQLFGKQVKRSPESIALVDEKHQLTYRELDEKSNQLARCIRTEFRQRTNLDLRPDTLIGLYLDRSVEMVVGILAVLKAGGAYVPIDPAYPQERIAYILEDTSTELVLSQAHLTDSNPDRLPKDKVILIDLEAELYQREDAIQLPQHSSAEDLAYVIYTSGTTGKPKGVMLNHVGIVNRIEWMQTAYPIGSEDVVLQKTPYVFDVSVWELLWANWYGAKIVMAKPEGHKDSEYLQQVIAEHKVTTLHFVPSMLNAFNYQLSESHQKFDHSIRQLICSGEALPEKVVKETYQNLGHSAFKLHNLYGPTEASIDVTYYETRSDAPVYIGKPIQNTQLYVLSPNHSPVPVGVIGELYLGGAGLARGYLNLSELTNDRFIPNPFATPSDIANGYSRLYKTGDLVKYMPDGNVAYLGRNDDQVKIRGHRIELPEIEHVLSHIPGIMQSSVQVRERSTESGLKKYIIGYYVLDGKHVSDHSNALSSWEHIYDSEYEKEIEETSIEADFTTWNSYISGNPIPLPEMEDWRDNIVSLIQKLNPERVLEVGVGSGILMYPLLNDVQRFVGLDLSREVINRHIKQNENKGLDTDFYHLSADQIDQIPSEELFDTIVINSVCQYFPSITYFEDMLEKAFGLLSETGSVFLGDIRNYDQQKILIEEKLAYEGIDYSQKDIDRIALKENELLISPSYFASLKTRYKNIRVDIFERKGKFSNELTRFRYDVVIYTAGKSESNDFAVQGDNATEKPKVGAKRSFNIPYLSQLKEEEILRQLETRLPAYMLPEVLTAMESFPVTINGKLDRRALPDPEFGSLAEEQVAPETELEASICAIWQKVMGLDRIGITDDFFRIGGDSILSIQVSSRIRQLGYNCQVNDIFECRTIAQLAERLSKTRSAAEIRSEQGILNGAFDLLPTQQWFTDQVDSGTLANPNHANQSFLIKVPPLVLEKLESAIAELVNYHDVLRLQFSREPHQTDSDSSLWKQDYQSAIDIAPLQTLDVKDQSPEAIQQILTDWQSGFDLEGGPLFQAGYLGGFEDGSARIFFALHHLIVDTVSWRILTEDLKTLYQGEQLPPKGSSYRQWGTELKNYIRKYPTESAYWETQLESLKPDQFTADRFETNEEFLELDSKLTQTLLHKAPKAYHTEINDLLLTALAYALKEINQDDIQGVTLEGHGREELDAPLDINRTVGWFTSMFPVKLELQSNLKESIRSIKESLRKIPNKGIGFGALAQNESTGFGFQDLVPVMFNYLGQFDSRDGNWQIAPENSGNSLHPANTKPYLISIDGSVSEARLQFNIATKLGPDRTKQFRDGFHKHLVQVIEHCQAQYEEEGSSFTPSDFKSVRLNQSLLDRLEIEAKQSQNEIQQIYPANSLQQGFVYHALSQPEDEAYRVQVLYDYQQELEVDKYLEAWKITIAQYPVLRTAFNWEEDIVQIVYKKGKLNHQLHDVSHLASQEERDRAIEAIRAEDRKQSFDLTRPTLVRLNIIKQASDCYTILKTEDHSILDGWSGPLLLKTVLGHYQALVNDVAVDLKEDRAYLMAQAYISKHKEDIHRYWDKTLEEVESANDINALLSQPIDLSSYKQVEQPAGATLEVKNDFYDQLTAFSQQSGITVNVIIQFVWHKLLQVYSSKMQSIVGTTVSGRDLPVEGIEKSVGLYINTLPLLIDWENGNTVLGQLQYIQQKTHELNTHSFADLVKLQKDGERLFHNLFVYENYPIPKMGKDSARITVRESLDGSDFPLGISTSEYSDMLEITLEYDAAYLSESKAKQHLASLERILKQVLEMPDEAHSGISVIGPEEKDLVFNHWNNTSNAFHQDKTIYEIFQQQAARTPDVIALVHGEEELSYGELNEKSNQLARYIRAQYAERTRQPLGPDTLVALCLDRSLEMVIGILGVLKAGAAYVPIDFNYPQERIEFILEDTQAELILSQRYLHDEEITQLPQDKVLYIDLATEIYNSEDASDLDLHSEATDLAYVIFTSGTTGRPKGVLVNHQPVLNLVNYHNRRYARLSDNLQVALLSNYIFDFSVQQIFSSLLYGHTLHVIANDLVLDPDGFNQYLKTNGIEVFEITPTLFSHLILPFDNYHEGPLKLINVGGESLPGSMVAAFLSKKMPNSFSMINTYGPTEYTVDATVYEIECQENTIHDQLAVPIGKPLDNTQVFILDPFQKVVPIGVVGELHLAGAGMARGYLNRADLTEARFIPNPYATFEDQEKGYERMYKTGDLVRWLPDGNIEFLGRNDDQVKIRGHRIELGEIENSITRIEGIKQCCVLAKERAMAVGTRKHLVAYYLLEKQSQATTEIEILDQLSQALPEYMVPDVLVKMESFPLTINGKINKRKLPVPDFNHSTEDYVAPTTETESTICGIWQEVLGREKVGITDDFFRIGGNSILAIQVSHKMSKVLGYTIQVADVFKFCSIENMMQNSAASQIPEENVRWTF